MRKYRKWVMTLGLAAVTPQIGLAGSFGLPWSKSDTPNATAPQEGAYNQQVANDVASKLREARLRGADIEIEFQSGTLTLKGRVADAATRSLATQLASQVGGVKSVSNQMTVAASATPAPAGSIQQVSGESPFAPNVQSAAFEAPAGTPSDIQQVAAAKQASTRNPATSRPSVSQSMPSPPLSKAAPSVPPAPAGNSQQTANSVANALAQAGLTSVDVRCQNGVCTLGGLVENPQQAEAAIRIARSTAGVTGVQHQLRMPAPQQAGITPANFQPGDPNAGAVPPGYPAGSNPGYGYPPGAVTPPPPAWGQPGAGAVAPVYDQPNLPEYAWPTTAAYPNYSALSYPQQYSASAWPYIGPFYPYPQVPLGWRKVTLEWDDGQWYLDFNDRTDRWWWFMNPKNW